jgi:hypothetical protein
MGQSKGKKIDQIGAWVYFDGDNQGILFFKEQAVFFPFIMIIL